MTFGHMRAVAVSAAAVAVLALAGTVQAGITFSDPGLYDTIEDRFESRIRLDGGSSQTWKTAFWDDTTLLSTSGVNQNVFGNGVGYDFSFTYDAGTGAASLDVAGLGLSDVITLDPGYGLAGVRFFTRSETDGETQVSGLSISVDGAPSVPVADFGTGLGEVFADGPTAYLDAPATTLAITGTVSFSWLDGANLQGERFKFSTKVLQGIPGPGAIALLAVAGLGGRRRRRPA